MKTRDILRLLCLFCNSAGMDTMKGNLLRQNKIVELPLRVGHLTLLDQRADSVSIGMRLLLMIALDVANSTICAKLEKVERFNFDILGARWSVEGGIVSVSLYLDGVQGVVKVHSGTRNAQDRATVISIQENLISVISKIAENGNSYQVQWEALSLDSSE